MVILLLQRTFLGAKEMKKQYRIQTLKWPCSVLAGLVIHLIKRPQSIGSVFQLLYSKIYKVPGRIRHEACLNITKNNLEADRSECALIYLEMASGDNENIVTWLEETRMLVKDRWGLLYMLVRKLKPQAVIETGVCEGKSTSYILQAMADNSEGHLTSIDLPNSVYIRDDLKLQVDFIPFRSQSGRLIPDSLKDRWTLIIGDTRKELKPLLEKTGEIDLFFHDSEHTYEMMIFELESAWPYIRPGGFLVADDVVINLAFSDFAKQRGLNSAIISGLGIIQKP